MPPKIDWSVKKENFVKQDLDLEKVNAEEFRCWKTEINHYLRECGATQDGINWESRQAALQNCINRKSVTKFEAVCEQLPVADRQDIDRIIEALERVAGAADNIWISRHRFEQCNQRPDQSFSAYYSDLLENIVTNG